MKGVSDGTAWRMAIVVLAGLLTYANALTNPFIFDDEGTVVQNVTIRRPGDAVSPPANTAVAGRPLVNLSFALNRAFGGEDPAGYRAVNLALHLACALLVFDVVRRTLRRTPLAGGVPASPADLAFAASLLFVVHPLTSEVVDYVTQRTEGLMALCYLLTVYASIRSHEARHARRWQVAAVVACIAGAGCKETIATAPLAVVLWDRAFVYASFTDALRSRWRLYSGLALTWLVLGAVLVSGGQSLAGGFSTARTSWWTYFLNQPRMIARYLWLSIWPGPLVLYYGWPVAVSLADVWPWLLVIAALFAGSVALVTRRPAIGYPAAWFFLTLGPTSSVIVIATEVGAERRMYLPLAGLIAGLVAGAAWLTRDRTRFGSRALVAATVLLAAALGIRTAIRNTEYASALTMARTVVDRWPTPNAEYLVGSELSRAGQSRESIPHLRAAVPGYPPARYLLGTALLSLGETVEGAAALEGFVRDEPSALASRVAHGHLANTYAAAGQFAAAIPHYREYLSANAADASAWTGLALAQMQTGDRVGALTSFHRAAAAQPGDRRFQLNLARALLDEGELREARRVIDPIAGTAHGDPAVYDLVGRLAVAGGNVAAARAAFERALQLDPNFAPARDALRSLTPRR